jgi:hypothetical protein
VRFFRRRRVTTPPRVFPLLPIGILAAFVGERTLDVLAGLATLVQLPFDDDFWSESDDFGTGDVAVGLAIDLPLLVGASLALRWLVRRWVVANPA